MKHGVPYEPERVRKRVIERVTVPVKQETPVQQAPPVQQAQPVQAAPEKKGTDKWQLAGSAAKILAAALIGGLGVYALTPKNIPETPVENQTLLEFLEDEGFNR